ncbi:MAG TPA: glycosyltransferase, partial [Pyrinomonadaceae bacterium]
MLSDIRVIFVLENFVLGGAERQASILARGLKERGCLVEVWAFAEGGPTTEILERYGIPWRCVRHPLRGFASPEEGLAGFGAELRRARPDLLLPYTLLPNIACALVWRSAGARLCIWNQSDAGTVRSDPQLERRAVAQTPLFISNSVGGAEFLVQSLGVSRDLIRVIRNGVELAAPVMDRAAVLRRLKIPDDSLVGCMIANLHGDKDHVTLIKAWWLVADGLRHEASPPLLLLAGRDYHTQAPLQEFAQR